MRRISNLLLALQSKLLQYNRDALHFMMSLGSIIAINEETSAKAAMDNRVPFVPNRPEDVDRWPPFPFPNLGYYAPLGWEITDQQWFVDKTGMGRAYQPALTISRFRDELRDFIAAHPGHGLAMTEEGECQAIITAFRRVVGETVR